MKPQDENIMSTSATQGGHNEESISSSDASRCINQSMNWLTPVDTIFYQKTDLKKFEIAEMIIMVTQGYW